MRERLRRNMEFRLTEEQILLKKTVQEFTHREIEPHAHEMDRSNRLPDDMILKLAGLQLLGMILPREYGGIGVSSLDCLLYIEQMSYSGVPAWWLLAFANTIPGCILKFGTEEQKKKFLPSVCSGQVYPSIQFTEAATGSDPRALITTAVPEGESFRVNGMKRFSTFGARNGFAVLYARDGDKRCTAFIIEKNAPGYSTSKPYELMGGGGVEAVDVYFDQLKVPAGNILGERGRGFDMLQFWVADEKIQQCGACLGMAQAALDEAVNYAGTREVMEKTQANLQGIRWMMAEMYSQLEAARWMTYRAACLKDQEDSKWITEAAATKLFTVPATMEVVEMSRRIHGGYGYTREFKIERLYRAIAGASAIAVSLEINKSIVAAQLLK